MVFGNCGEGWMVDSFHLLIELPSRLVCGKVGREMALRPESSLYFVFY